MMLKVVVILVAPHPPPHDEQPIVVVVWSILTIQENPKDDGTATQLVDED